jgi:hypothetical protein
LHGKPLQPPTFISLPCCAILACSKVENSNENFVIQMNPWCFLLLVISGYNEARVIAQKERQWASPRFISVVWASRDSKISVLTLWLFKTTYQVDLATCATSGSGRHNKKLSLEDLKMVSSCKVWV